MRSPRYCHGPAALLLVLLALVLAACAPTTVRPDAALLAAQQAREQQLAEYPQWTVQGRLAVSAHGDGGSGSLVWEQRASGLDFVLQAPVTGRSFRLHVDAAGARLDGLDGGPVRGADARSVLARTLGWQVPVKALAWWVRGLRAPGYPAELRFGNDGLPATLTQAGWLIEYRDWYTELQTPLPRRVYASRGDERVKLLINHWSLLED